MAVVCYSKIFRKLRTIYGDLKKIIQFSFCRPHTPQQLNCHTAKLTALLSSLLSLHDLWAYLNDQNRLSGQQPLKARGEYL